MRTKAANKAAGRKAAATKAAKRQRAAREALRVIKAALTYWASRRYGVKATKVIDT